jgi:hypothetical protein
VHIYEDISQKTKTILEDGQPHEKSSSAQQIAPWYAHRRRKKRRHKYQSALLQGKIDFSVSVGGKKRHRQMFVFSFFLVGRGAFDLRPLLIPGMTHKSQAAKWRGPLFVDISARER